MIIDSIFSYLRGWWAGSFDPAFIKTNDYELALKYYKQGDFEASHCHKLSREITIVAHGIVAINGVEYGRGAMITQEPREYADFRCVSEEAITVVHRPDGSHPSDKYFAETK